MENTKIILSAVLSSLPFIVSSITFLIKFIKNRDAKKALDAAKRVNDALQPLIIEAEKFVHYTGAEKKEFVITRVAQFAMENKIKIDSALLSDSIDELVDTTKKVNSCKAAT